MSYQVILSHIKLHYVLGSSTQLLTLVDERELITCSMSMYCMPFLLAVTDPHNPLACWGSHDICQPCFSDCDSVDFDLDLPSLSPIHSHFADGIRQKETMFGEKIWLRGKNAEITKHCFFFSCLYATCIANLILAISFVFCCTCRSNTAFLNKANTL